MLAVVFTIIIAFTAKSTIDEYQIQNQNLVNDIQTLQNQNNTQLQELNNELTNIQTQYQIMQNILTQEQTVDVIQARENDVLIKTPDDKWLVVPMIDNTDLEFSSELIETQYNAGDSSLPRVDLFKTNNDDWSGKDSFTYTLPYLSIDQNKMVSLYQFINRITIEFKLYNSNQIDYYSEFHDIMLKGNNYTYLNVFENISPEKQYVTNEVIGSNGIEDIKINVIIEYEIGGSVFSIPYTFDAWVNVNQDF